MGCVSAVDDIDSNVVSINENSEVSEFKNIEDVLSYSDDESELSAITPTLTISDSEHRQPTNNITRDTTVTIDIEAKADFSYHYDSKIVNVLVNDKDYTSVTLSRDGYSYEKYVGSFDYTFKDEGTYVIKGILQPYSGYAYDYNEAISNSITYVVGSGSGGNSSNGTTPENASATLTIYDMAYPDNSTIYSDGEYVSDIAYSLIKSGDGFTDEALEVIVNGQSIGRTTPNSYQRLGNLKFTEDNEWVLTVIYTATVNGNLINVTSNPITFITNNTPKGSPNIRISVDDIKYGQEAVILVDMARDSTGNVEIFLNGEVTTVPIDSGKANLNVSGLKAGNYEVTVNYDGDLKYSGESVSTNFTVSKNHLDLNVSVEDIMYGETAIVEVNLPKDVPGNVKIVIDNTAYRIKINSGKAILEVPKLKAGTHKVTVNYAGNVKYETTSVSTSYSVFKNALDMNIVANDIIQSENVNIDVSVPNDLPGNVWITVDNNRTYCVKINSGKASIELAGFKQGTHNVTVKYNGNAKYANSTAETSFTVSKAILNIVPIVEDITYGEDATISVNLPSDVPGNVRFIVDGKVYRVKIVSGKASVNIPGLKPGSHNLTVTYAGNIKYEATAMETTFNVNKLSPNLSVYASDINYGESADIEVDIAEDAPGNVKISLNGQTYRTSINSGHAGISLDDLEVGSYTVTVLYAGNYKYENAVAITTFKVN